MIERLPEAGADANAREASVVGNTPLGQTSGSCFAEVAKRLVEAGADPTILGWMRLTALHRAARRKKTEEGGVYALLRAAAEKG